MANCQLVAEICYIPHGRIRHRDTTTPSHGPHARRCPLLVTDSRTAPRRQLSHATRDCPLQSLRGTVTPQSTRLGWPRSWPSPERSKFCRTNTPSGASQSRFHQLRPQFFTRPCAARILVSSSSEAQTPRFTPSEREKTPSFTWLDLTNAQRTAMLPKHMQRYVAECRSDHVGRTVRRRPPELCEVSPQPPLFFASTPATCTSSKKC